MPRTAYTPVAESSEPASVELTSATKLQDELPQRNAEAFTVGKPRSKPVFEWIDLGALLCSLACLIASICVVTPKLSLAWRLGYDLQIVVIGFLLSIMNLCFKRIAPIIFPILEARWGRSSLQNYDAIIRNTLWLSQTNTPWRLVILTLIGLPLGLSAAYKRFTGGHSSATITSHYPGHYGLTIPPLGAYSTMNNSIYVMMDAYAPFMLASSNDSVQPPFAELPVAYGYNTLLLDNASAALLDLPMPDYISSIRKNLRSDESWEITASVNATVARHDESIEMNRNNNSSWQSTFDDSWDRGNNGLTSFQMYDYEYDFGLVTGNVSLANGASCFLGPYNGSTIRIKFIRNATESDSLSFRSAALMFNVRREQCAGSWQINRTDIALLSGNCTQPLQNQSIILGPNAAPFSLDVLPVLVHTLFDYADKRSQSKWLLPAYATSVATMSWVRLAFILPGGAPPGPNDTSVNYPATSEHIVSTRTTLDTSNGLLYLVIAIQPVLTTALFVKPMLLYSKPFSQGFGMVAVLSGIDKDSIDIIEGATLSGELRKPVKLGIEVVNDVQSRDGSQSGRIRYTFGQGPQRTLPLERGKKYM